MARIGYARVSTLDQDLDTQLARLRAEGCGIVRAEKVSGGSREGRAELAMVIEFLRPGDELVVSRLDRLGRDTRDVLNLIHEAEQRGASVTVLDPHVSTRGAIGHIVLTVLGMVAQMERRFIKERQRKGIERTKAEGVFASTTLPSVTPAEGAASAASSGDLAAPSAPPAAPPLPHATGWDRSGVSGLACGTYGWCDGQPRCSGQISEHPDRLKGHEGPAAFEQPPLGKAGDEV